MPGFKPSRPGGFDAAERLRLRQIARALDTPDPAERAATEQLLGMRSSAGPRSSNGGNVFDEDEKTRQRINAEQGRSAKQMMKDAATARKAADDERLAAQVRGVDAATKAVKDVGAQFDEASDTATLEASRARKKIRDNEQKIKANEETGEKDPAELEKELKAAKDKYAKTQVAADDAFEAKLTWRKSQRENTAKIDAEKSRLDVAEGQMKAQRAGALPSDIDPLEGTDPTAPRADRPGTADVANERVNGVAPVVRAPETAPAIDPQTMTAEQVAALPFEQANEIHVAEVERLNTAPTIVDATPAISRVEQANAQAAALMQQAQQTGDPRLFQQANGAVIAAQRLEQDLAPVIQRHNEAIDAHNKDVERVQAIGSVVEGMHAKALDDEATKMAAKPGMGEAAESIRSLDKEYMAIRRQTTDDAGSKAAFDTYQTKRKELLDGAESKSRAAWDAMSGVLKTQKSRFTELKSKGEFTAHSPTLNKENLDAEREFQRIEIEDAGKEHGLTPEQADTMADDIVKVNEWHDYLNKTADTAHVLSDGRVVVNPALWVDPPAYEKAVNESGATPEAKKGAMAILPDLRKEAAANMLNSIAKSETLAEVVNALPGKTDEERVSALLAKQRDFAWFKAVGARMNASAESMAGGLMGLISMATGNEWATESMRRWNERASAHETLASAGGLGPVANFLSKAPGGVESVIPAMAGGFGGRAVAVKMLGAGAEAAAVRAAATRGAMVGSTIAAGLQSTGSTYGEAFDAYLRANGGKNLDDARSKAIAPALVSGLITAAATYAGGTRGLESLFREPAGRTMVKKTLWEALKRGGVAYLKEGAEEFLEEGTDQLGQAILAKATYDPNKPLSSIIGEVLEAGGLGFIIGSGMGVLTNARDARARDDLSPAGQEVQSAAELAESDAELANYQPVATTTGQPDVAHIRARVLRDIGQGQSLDALPPDDLGAIGMQKTGAGEFKPATGKDALPPAIEMEGKKPIILQPELDAMAQAFPKTRAMIRMTADEARAKATGKPVIPTPAAGDTPGVTNARPAKYRKGKGVIDVDSDTLQLGEEFTFGGQRYKVIGRSRDGKNPWFVTGEPIAAKPTTTGGTKATVPHVPRGTRGTWEATTDKGTKLTLPEGAAATQLEAETLLAAQVPAGELIDLGSIKQVSASISPTAKSVTEQVMAQAAPIVKQMETTGKAQKLAGRVKMLAQAIEAEAKGFAGVEFVSKGAAFSLDVATGKLKVNLARALTVMAARNGADAKRWVQRAVDEEFRHRVAVDLEKTKPEFKKKLKTLWASLTPELKELSRAAYFAQADSPTNRKEFESEFEARHEFFRQYWQDKTFADTVEAALGAGGKKTLLELIEQFLEALRSLATGATPEVKQILDRLIVLGEERAAQLKGETVKLAPGKSKPEQQKQAKTEASTPKTEAPAPKTGQKGKLAPEKSKPAQKTKEAVFAYFQWLQTETFKDEPLTADRIPVGMHGGHTFQTSQPFVKKGYILVDDKETFRLSDLLTEYALSEFSKAEGGKKGKPATSPTVKESLTVDDAAHEAATSPKNDLPEPTEAQKEAENHRVGRVKLGPLEISIETPAGAKRHADWPALKDHYGRILGTTGADSTPEQLQHLDAFVREGTPADWNGPVFVVNQNKPDGTFDETKTVFGAKDASQAKATYLRNYAKDWRGFGSLVVFPDIATFKQWTETADMKKPASRATTEAQAKATKLDEKAATVKNPKIAAILKGKAAAVRAAGGVAPAATAPATPNDDEDGISNAPSVDPDQADPGTVLDEPQKPQPTAAPETPANRTPEQQQETFAKFRRGLRKALGKKDWIEVLKQVEAFNAHYDKGPDPYPDSWSEWSRAGEEARAQIIRDPELRKQLTAIQEANALAENTPVVPITKPLVTPPPKSGVSEATKQQMRDAFEGLLDTAPAGEELNTSPPSETEQRSLPPGKLPAFIQLASQLVSEGVRTPEALALAIDETFPGGKARPYSQALWDAIGMVDNSLRATHDWNTIYSGLAIEQNQPNTVTESNETPSDVRGAGEKPSRKPGSRGNLPGGKKRKGNAPNVGEGVSADAPPPDGSGDSSGVRDGAERPGVPSGEGSAGGVQGTTSGDGKGDDSDRPGERGGVDQPTLPARSNYFLADPESIVGGGPKARFAKNRDAISTYENIILENREPTPEELDKLAAYTGWGSFGQELFNGTWSRPAPKPGWEEEDKWLRDNLGEQAWKSAQESIINAHYTDPPTVISMWDMIRRMGFRGGRVLEPSIGIGNFYSLMPRDLMANSKLTGIEKDTMTGRIAKMLHPQANVQIKGYEESQTADNFYDLTLGNWPFASEGPADRRFNNLAPSLHDYFFAKALAQTRPGGIVIGITSSGTMDKKSPVMRRYLASQAELVAAFRLPSGSFEKYAGTKVVTDIIILKKREAPLGDPDKEGWIKSEKDPEGKDFFYNEYYQKRPENILGKIGFGSGTTFGRAGMVVTRPEGLMEMLKNLANRLPEGVFEPWKASSQKIEYIANTTSVKRQGALVEHGGDLHMVEGEQLKPLQDVVKWKQSDAKKTEKRLEEARAIMRLRDLYDKLMMAYKGEGDTDKARVALKKEYDAFVKRFGSPQHSRMLQILVNAKEPSAPSILNLDEMRDGKIVPRAILTKDIMRRSQPSAAGNIEDAYSLHRNNTVHFDLAEIAKLAKTTPETVEQRLVEHGQIFKTPAGQWEPRDIYLSGNVRQKLREAIDAQENQGQKMGRNIEALKEVQPPDTAYFDIEVKMGANWITKDDYVGFISHLLNTDAEHVDIQKMPSGWNVKIGGNTGSQEARNVWGTPDIHPSQMFGAAMNGTSLTVRRHPENAPSYVDKEATEKANGKVEAIREELASWLWKDGERTARLSRNYNEAMNSTATPKRDGSHLRLEGLALTYGDDEFSFRKHQVDAVWRGILDGRGTFFHEVGTGKTFTIAGIAMEGRRLGTIRKSLIFAHNANHESVAADYRFAYPAAKLLHLDDLSPKKRDSALRQIALDDWDSIIVPHSLIDRFALKEETMMSLARDEIEAMEREIYDAADEVGVSLIGVDLDDEAAVNLAIGRTAGGHTAKNLVKARNRIIKRIKEKAQKHTNEGAIYFEDLGIDAIMVDEAHIFKKIALATRKNIKGLNKTESGLGFSLQLLTDYVKKQNGGKGVFMFTGTPVTNTLNEVYNMMRFVMDDVMAQAGINGFDDWFNNFADTVNEVELTSGGTYEATERLLAFINVPELARMAAQHFDVVQAKNMPEFTPRTSEDGISEKPIGRPSKKTQAVVSEMSPEQRRVHQEIEERYNAYKKLSGKDKRKRTLTGGDTPIIMENDGSRNAIDPRYYNPSLPDHPESKLNKMVHKILGHYNEHEKSTQMVFMEKGMNDYTVSEKKHRDGEGYVIKDPTTNKAMTYKQVTPQFNLARDIVQKLVAGGVRPEEIAVFSNMTLDKESERPDDVLRKVQKVTGSVTKEDLAAMMRQGKIRVAIGGTQTMGTGVNAQTWLRAMHHLDAPWTPGEFEQRNGRGWRQGNKWNTVHEYRYLTEGSHDGKRWQTLLNKVRFIHRFTDMLLNPGSGQRVLEGEGADTSEGGDDTVGDFESSFSSAAGDPRLLLKAKLEKEVRKLETRRNNHARAISDAQQGIERANESIRRDQISLGSATRDLEAFQRWRAQPFSITLGDKTYTERKDADEAIARLGMNGGTDHRKVGQMGEFKIMQGPKGNALFVDGPGLMRSVGDSMQSIEGTLRNMTKLIDRDNEDVAKAQQSLIALRELLTKPFSRQGELDAKKEALGRVEAELRASPTPAPGWLRHGVPQGSLVYLREDGKLKAFDVMAHRWDKNGYWVLIDRDSEMVPVSYDEVLDEAGTRLLPDQEFKAPENAKPTDAPPAPPTDGDDGDTDAQAPPDSLDTPPEGEQVPERPHARPAFTMWQELNAMDARLQVEALDNAWRSFYVAAKSNGDSDADIEAAWKVEMADPESPVVFQGVVEAIRERKGPRNWVPFDVDHTKSAEEDASGSAIDTETGERLNTPDGPEPEIKALVDGIREASIDPALLASGNDHELHSRLDAILNGLDAKTLRKVAKTYLGYVPPRRIKETIKSTAFLPMRHRPLNTPDEDESDAASIARLNQMLSSDLPSDEDIEALREIHEAEVPGDFIIGDPRIANPGDTDDNRKLFDVAREIYGAAMLERQKQQDWDTAGKQMADSDPEGVQRMVLEAYEESRILTPVETRAAVHLNRNVMTSALLSGNDAKLRNAIGLAVAYYSTGSEAARALAARVDTTKTRTERFAEFVTEAITNPQRAEDRVTLATLPRAADKARTIARLTRQIEAAQAAHDSATVQEKAKERAAEHKKQTREDLALQIAKQQRDEIAKALKKEGLTIEDLLDGRIQYRIKFGRMVMEAMGGNDPRREKAIDLLVHGWASVDISKATRLTEEEVNALRDELRSKPQPLREALAKMIQRGQDVTQIAASLSTAPETLDTAATMSWEDALAEADRVLDKLIPTSQEADRTRWRKIRRVRKGTSPDATLERTIKAMESPKAKGSPNPMRELINAHRTKKGVTDFVDKAIKLGASREIAEEAHELIEAERAAKVKPVTDVDLDWEYVPYDFNDKSQTYRVMRGIDAVAKPWFDMVSELWINAILSGLQTQAVNLVGNLATSLWDMTVQRLAEGAVGTLTGNGAASLGEFGHMARGILPGIVNGAKMAFGAFSTEKDLFDTTYLNSTVDAEEELDRHGTTTAIPGVTGRVVRIPGRLLRAADGFFKTAIAHIEVGAMAHRIGRKQGLRGKALERWITAEVSTPGSKSWKTAAEKAKENTFQDENATVRFAEKYLKASSRGRLQSEGQALAEARKADPDVEKIRSYLSEARWHGFWAAALRFIFPFVRTPINIFRMGLKKSPVGSAFLALNLMKGLVASVQGKGFFNKYPAALFARQLSEQALSWTAMVLLWGLTEGDDDDDKKTWLLVGGRPYARSTGAGDADAAQRNYGGTYMFVKQENGRVVRQIPFGRIEPLATALGLMVDAMAGVKRHWRNRKQGESGTAAMRTAMGIASNLRGQAEDKTFLRGVSNLSQAWDALQDPATYTGSGALKILNDIATGFVPNLAKQGVRSVDDFQRNYKQSDWTHAWWPDGKAANPLVDLYGRDVKKSGPKWLRLVWPTPNQVNEREPADTLVKNWNLKHPDNVPGDEKGEESRYFPPRPSKANYEMKGIGPMTRPQMREFDQTAGKRFETLQNNIPPVEQAVPKFSALERLKKRLSDSRESAKKTVTANAARERIKANLLKK